MAALFLSSPKQPLSPPLVGSGRPITTTTITFLKTRSPRNQNQKPLSTIAFSSSSSSSFRNENTSPEAECPVPLDQQPVNEYQSLSTSFPFSWASGDIRDYCSRLFFTGSAFAHFVGLPIACFGVVNPESQPLMCVFGAVSSGILVVTLAVLRMYLGWAYVGNRLLSATVEYEETGWYDGQIWVKTDEILARDRLLGSFSVKPVLSRLKFTLVGLAVSLVICVLILISTESSRKDQGHYISSEEAGGRVVAGVYNEESAKSFEPDAFCGGPGVP